MPDSGQGSSSARNVIARASERVTVDCGVARVFLDPAGAGRTRVRVDPVERAPALRDGEWTTQYPVPLILEILKTKGPAWVLDEIRRDECPVHVQPELELGMLAYSAPEDFKDARILDFGCGMGSSTMVLARIFPDSTIVAVDFVDRFVDVARMRWKFWAGRLGQNGSPAAKVQFVVSPDSERLPDDLGLFDAIVLAGVYEHLLPGSKGGREGGERAAVMERLWAHLKPAGVMYLNQTPWRWSPWECHTTRLPFVNYLPGALVSRMLRFSRHVAADTSWPELLRHGIRGGSVREIVGLLQAADRGHIPVVLKPNHLQVKDRIDLWYEACMRRPQRRTWPKRLYRRSAKLLAAATGIEALPTLTLALAKQRQGGQSGSNKSL